MGAVDMKLDEKDRKIITLLSDNPDISQDAIAMEIELSQPSVALRMKKLREMGIIQNMYGMDLLKMGLSIAKVDVTTRNTTKVLKSLGNCPYFLNGFIVSGESNLCLFFIGEDIATLEAIVDCHLRQVDEIQNVRFNIVIGVAKKLVMPLRTNFRKEDKAPCGIQFTCGDCPIYGERCRGCPVTGHYKGTLW